MKSRSLAFLIVPGLILAGLSAKATTPPAAAPGLSAAPSASASAVSSAKPPRPAPPEPLETQTIPQEPSPRPTLDEWKNATKIRVTRHASRGQGCETFRVREWLKVKCALSIAAVKQLGGNTDNVFFWVGANKDIDWDLNNGGEVMFRMHPGDQRIFEFFTIFPEQCFGRQAFPWLIVDETWLEGETKPTVVIR